ncbi:MAG: hypothetical protein KDK39_17055 [Leptospiraceae bacterium]|nr:hypothetical protein [Leptospiraceae bacterium]
MRFKKAILPTGVRLAALFCVYCLGACHTIRTDGGEMAVFKDLQVRNHGIVSYQVRESFSAGSWTHDGQYISVSPMDEQIKLLFVGSGYARQVQRIKSAAEIRPTHLVVTFYRDGCDACIMTMFGYGIAWPFYSTAEYTLAVKVIKRKRVVQEFRQSLTMQSWAHILLLFVGRNGVAPPGFDVDSSYDKIHLLALQQLLVNFLASTGG